jgi:hypothetical protein
MLARPRLTLCGLCMYLEESRGSVLLRVMTSRQYNELTQRHVLALFSSIMGYADVTCAIVSADQETAGADSRRPVRLFVSRR